MQNLTSQICMSNQNGFDTYFADLYKAISNASLDFISSVHRDTVCHDNSQQEMNLAIGIVDTAVSEEGLRKDAAVMLAWIVLESSKTPTEMDRVRELVWRSTVDRATRVPAQIWAV